MSRILVIKFENKVFEQSAQASKYPILDVKEKSYGYEVRYLARMVYNRRHLPRGSPVLVIERLDLRINLDHPYAEDPYAAVEELMKIAEERGKNGKPLFGNVFEAMHWFYEVVVKRAAPPYSTPGVNILARDTGGDYPSMLLDVFYYG